MMKRQIGILAYVCLLTSIGIGCDFQKDTLTSSLGDEALGPSENVFPATNKFFTGRDSFGVAFKVRLTGQAEVSSEGPCPDQTVVLSGFGNATHLGSIAGTLTHCAEESDPSSVQNGEFEFRSSTGLVLGEYEPLPVVLKHGNGNGDVIETKADIAGGEIAAVKHDEVVGRGDLHILIEPDGSFTQTFDGWLLHHVVEE